MFKAVSQFSKVSRFVKGVAAIKEAGLKRANTRELDTALTPLPNGAETPFSNKVKKAFECGDMVRIVKTKDGVKSSQYGCKAVVTNPTALSVNRPPQTDLVEVQMVDGPQKGSFKNYLLEELTSVGPEGETPEPKTLRLTAQ